MTDEVYYEDEGFYEFDCDDCGSEIPFEPHATLCNSDPFRGPMLEDRWRFYPDGS
jgi:hypothetical protein